MARLIDADKLKKHYAWWKGGTRELTMDEAKSDFDTIIDLQPTIEPKRGRWITSLERTTGGHGVYTKIVCSECGKSAVDMYSFCPNCGAKMDEVEDNG